MVALTHTDPDVLTDHTDMICSTSIERIVTGCNATLSLTEILIHQLSDISALTDSLGGGKANEWGVRQYRYGCWLTEYNSERPHESLNNLMPEEFRLMVGNALPTEISKSTGS